MIVIIFKDICIIICTVLDLGPAEATPASQKRKAPSPPHSSNGHSPSDTSPSGVKKKKKPGLVTSNNKDQVGPRPEYTSLSFKYDKSVKLMKFIAEWQQDSLFEFVYASWEATLTPRVCKQISFMYFLHF